MFQFWEYIPDSEKESFSNSVPLNYNIFRFGNMVPEIEIKISESETITEIVNTNFHFSGNEYYYLFIYVFIYLFILFYFYFACSTFFNVKLFNCGLNLFKVYLTSHLPTHELHSN